MLLLRGLLGSTPAGAANGGRLEVDRSIAEANVQRALLRMAHRLYRKIVAKHPQLRPAGGDSRAEAVEHWRRCAAHIQSVDDAHRLYHSREPLGLGDVIQTIIHRKLLQKMVPNQSVEAGGDGGELRAVPLLPPAAVDNNADVKQQQDKAVEVNRSACLVKPSVVSVEQFVQKVPANRCCRNAAVLQ